MKRLLPLVLLCLLAPNTYADGAGPMWVLPVARLCVAQEPRFATTFLGQWIAQSRLRLDSREFEQCAVSRQWIPAHICTELMSLETEKALSRSNLERLGARYSPELKILEVAAPYVMDAAGAHDAGKALPPCPSASP